MKIAIIHFMPLEYYPPITNLLNFLKHKIDVDIEVYTCENKKKRKTFDVNGIQIIRFPFVEARINKLIKLLRYTWFNLGALFRLLLQNPKVVLYYESYSALPVYWYKRYFNRNVRVFIHNHEYFDRKWFENGMDIVRFYHNKEISFLYSEAEWISQTNAFRKKLFHRDHPFVNEEKIQILANYPPKDWQNHKTTEPINNCQKKLVYVGSLSLTATFIKECCSWIDEQAGKVTLDIFAYNLDLETKTYLDSLNSQWINFNDNGVEYYNLPNILCDYDIGLILYKAKSSNFKYNETNKLFEYLVCGLDVWFSKVMEGTYPFICKTNHPRVVDVDFENMDNHSEVELYGKGMLPNRSLWYNCEDEYEKLYKNLIGEV